jgi:beta-lactamase superfamily II metal-dependent hydrolase
MNSYFEIDFLDVESAKSGDAITIRYDINGRTTIHIVDGGFQGAGDKIIEHINKHYKNPKYIDHVVVTHPDGDHAGGLRRVIEKFKVCQLWMLRPWIYADELIDRFSRFTSVDNLKKRLIEIYPNISALEEIAEKRGIRINEPFQGAKIGAFTVLAPTRMRYLDLVVESEKTPEATKDVDENFKKSFFEGLKAGAITFFRALWGEENFSDEDTSAENEMSVVQYASLCGKSILLTGDVGRDGLSEAADYALLAGISLPGIDRFQVPHHGSRRNVSTEVLDRWLGQRLPKMPKEGAEIFTALISAAKADEHHPRKAVVRAMIHRGAKVISTEEGGMRISRNAPSREGWSPVKPLKYPEEQEE